MAELAICGGKPLCGEIEIQGSKNSAVAILMACIAVKGKVVLRRVPFITDVLNCIEILKRFGASVEWQVDGALVVDCRVLEYAALPPDVTGKMRASTYLMGACLSRFGRCDPLCFGGCALGERPVDIHLEVLRKIGVEYRDGTLFLGCLGGEVEFSRVTVGGTVNAILSAVCCDGECGFKNCAKEPHVCDFINFLNNCGAEISGCGGSVITVRGVEHLHGCEFSLSGDMIEAGTYLIGGAATGGSVTVRGVSPLELVALNRVFLDMGYRVECDDDSVCVSGLGCGGNSVETGEYPAFPTDLHPQMVALMGRVGGGALVENVFGADRFGYVNELAKFGLDCSVDGNRIVVSGSGYHSAKVDATDLRGGAALLIAALCAKGESVVGRVDYIERGYSDFITKFRLLGATIGYIGV